MLTKSYLSLTKLEVSYVLKGLRLHDNNLILVKLMLLIYVKLKTMKSVN